MSRLRPAMSAPRRPTNATSAPSAASHAATFAPEPPPCMVTVAGVSLPRASGSVAWATVSVIKSPMTTMRAIVVTTSSAGQSGGEPPVAGAGDRVADKEPDRGTLRYPHPAHAGHRVRPHGYESGRLPS